MLKEFNTKQPSAIKGCHLTPILSFSVKNLQTFYYLPKLRFVESRVSMAVFSRALFLVAKRVATGNLVKTVTFQTRLKLSESANFNRILIKFKPPNQVA